VYFGGVGDDEVGTAMENACKSQGVEPVFFRTTEKPTGASAALVYEKDRTLMCDT